MQDIYDILIVDDNTELAQNLNDILCEKDYGTAVALDGQSAIELCQKKEFDLALVDIKLSDIGGLELIEMLSELSPALEYIIITGYGTMESAVEAVRQKKIIAYEAKPINMEQLLFLIEQVVERRRAEEKIQKDIKEKEILLKEIHHRVKNNLQVIKSLIFLQTRQVKNKTVLKALNECIHRIHSMALVHSQLYQSHDFSSISFREYTEKMSGELLRSYNLRAKISLDLRIEDTPLGIDTAIPCGLILNELFTNALKYAFPNKKRGRLQVSLRLLKDKSYEFIFRDNGVGIPYHINFDETESLSLHLVKMLTEQINGTITMKRENGTVFKVLFPSQ